MVMPRGKLPRDVDRVAYRRRCSRRVVAGLTDTGRPRVQMDDKIGGPTQVPASSRSPKALQAPFDSCGGRERLSVSLLRSDFETEDRGHAISQELDWDPPSFRTVSPTISL